MSIHYIFLALIFGLILGSFLNVCIYRIPLKKSIIHPPSSCPQCGRRIRFYDNIPVISYMLLLGKCRSCHKKIPLRYPVVELTTGLLSTALFVRYGVSPQYFLLLSFCASLIVISFVDLDHQIIPDVISLPGIMFGFALSIFPAHPVSWLDSMFAVILGGVSLYLVRIVYEWLGSKVGIEGGDITLPEMIGAWTGWRTLPDVIVLFFCCASLFVIRFVDNDHQTVSWLDSLIGIILGGGSLYLVGAFWEWLRGKAAMGYGDVKLLAMIGAWMGWRALPFVILLSSFTGTIIGGGSLLLAGRKFSEKIPFGPFLVLGSLGYLFFENELRTFWYYYLQLK